MPISHKKCTICKSSKIEFHFETVDYLTERTGHWKYDKCLDCGYVFLNPEPTEQEISEFYNSNYHKVHYHAPVGINVQKSTLEQLKLWLKKQTLINHFNITGLGKKSFIGYLLGLVLVRSMKINLFPASINAKDKILEIGSSTGSRIALLKEYGFHNLHANEFNVELSKDLSKKFNIESSFVDIRMNPHLKANSFDFVVASMVLEHATDPVGFVDRIYDILKPGAYFAFSVPNLECLEFKLFGSRLYALHAPYHLSQFDEASIKKLLGKFENIDFYYQKFDRDWVVSARRTYQEIPTLRNRILSLSENKIIRKTILRLFFSIYGLFGKTSRVSVYARKPFVKIKETSPKRAKAVLEVQA